MKVLVTGGAGYLGSVLVRDLLKRGHQVTVVDKFLYTRKSLRLKNKNLKIVEGDIRDVKLMDRLIKECDAVIHLAAIVGNPACQLNKSLAFTTNSIATGVIALLCGFYGKKLLYASTCSVYGRGNNTFTELDHVSPKDMDFYAKTKFTGEILVAMSHHDWLIFRLGTLFGYSPRPRYDLAINLFIAKGINGEPLTVYGGNQWRPFLHVKDASEAFCEALERDWNGLYNLYYDNYRIKKVAKLIAKRYKVKVKCEKKLVDERNYRAKALLRKFVPKRSIQDAMEEFERLKKPIKYWSRRCSNYKKLKSLLKS